MLKGSKLTWDAVWECVKCCAKFEKWNNAGTWLEIFLSPSPARMYKARQVDIYCLKVFVCFLGELRTPSFTFEIIWPLVTFFVKIYWCCGVYEHRMAKWYFLKSNNLPHASCCISWLTTVLHFSVARIHSYSDRPPDLLLLAEHNDRPLEDYM